MERVMGNIMVRGTGSGMDKLLKKGGVVEGEEHNFDHVTLLFRGKMRATKKKPDGTLLVDRVCEGPHYLLIEAGMWHRFESLEDGTVAHCIYAHRTPQGEVTQQYNGWNDAYS
jgi:hypothetical protein